LSSEAAIISGLADSPTTPHTEPRRNSQTRQQHARPELLIFAARLRAARAVLGWSQTELGKKAKITQRAIYRLEKAAVKARHHTEVRINKVFEDAGIGFAQLPSGGFEMIVQGQLVNGLQQKSEPQN
jgi:ribosome-binding protein aMBF1 (putative translation factor)